MTVICMITAPLEPGDARGARSVIDRIRAAAGAEVHLVQIRQPQLDARSLLGLVKDARKAVEGTRARVIVNDRVDVGLEAGAHGVHLRGDGPPAVRIRRIVRPPMLVGRSVHERGEAKGVTAGDGLDYLIFGSVFAPRSKPAGAVAGVEALAQVCEAVALPVLAVGGMTVERLGAVAAAGAAGFAAIGLFADPPIDAIAAIVQEAACAFDTARSVS